MSDENETSQDEIDALMGDDSAKTPKADTQSGAMKLDEIKSEGVSDDDSDDYEYGE